MNCFLLLLILLDYTSWALRLESNFLKSLLGSVRRLAMLDTASTRALVSSVASRRFFRSLPPFPDFVLRLRELSRDSLLFCIFSLKFSDMAFTLYFIFSISRSRSSIIKSSSFSCLIFSASTDFSCSFLFRLSWSFSEPSTIEQRDTNIFSISKMSISPFPSTSYNLKVQWSFSSTANMQISII